MFDVTITGWALTLGFIGGLIAFDLWQSRRNPHAIGLGEAVAWSLFYIAIAILFGAVLGFFAGWSPAGQYFAGYLVERSLSIDNLFVFVIVMSTFAVPTEQRSRLLMLGIVGALILRAVFIAVGAAMLEAFSPTYLVFGLVLVATGVQLFLHRDKDPSVGDNVVVTAARRFFPVAEAYDGRRLLARGSGRLALTPLALALLAIATTDVVFALDSIPAVFGVTQHAYIVFVANAFALLGLRPLFFLVSGLLDRLVYLSTGLAVVLAFIGLKLMLHFAHLQADAVPEVSTVASLAIIVLVLAVTTVASLVKARRDPTARAHAGRALSGGTAHEKRSGSRAHPALRMRGEGRHP